MRLTRARLPKGIATVVIAQLAVTLLAAAGMLLIGIVEAYSALLGGLASAVPSGYAVWRVFLIGDRTARDAHSGGQVLGTMFRAELGKFALTGACFAFIFLLVKPLSVPVLFLVFAVTTLFGWCLAAWHASARRTE